jgi:hypothetical protein
MIKNIFDSNGRKIYCVVFAECRRTTDDGEESLAVCSSPSGFDFRRNSSLSNEFDDPNDSPVTVQFQTNTDVTGQCYRSMSSPSRYGSKSPASVELGNCLLGQTSSVADQMSCETVELSGVNVPYDVIAGQPELFPLNVDASSSPWRSGVEDGAQPIHQQMLRSARKSMSRVNDYLANRLSIVGAMYGRKDRSATKRERKATKTLAIVLGW